MSKPTLLLSAPVFNRSGYGDLSTDIARCLVRSDRYDIKIALQKWGQCQSKHFEDELKYSIDKEIYGKIMKEPLRNQPEIYMQITIPNEFLMTQPGTQTSPPVYQKIGKFNIGVTAGIETDIASGEFVEGVNRMDLTIVTSKFVKDVFENTKLKKRLPNGTEIPVSVNKPMEVCFWGANTDIYKKTDEHVKSVDEEIDKIPEDFAFLFVGQWTSLQLYNDRKDISKLIETFIKAFRNVKKKPCLILKTSGMNFSTMDRFRMLQLIHEIQKQFTGDIPNVYLLHGELDDYEMNALFNHPKIKCHVSFTHGEGFGHPLLLQTLSGKPLFVSDWSGHKDFLNPQYANLLPGNPEPVPPNATNQWMVKGSRWFSVSYNLAEEKLKGIFMNYSKEKFHTNAENLRLENMEKFSIKAMEKRLLEIMDKYVPKFTDTNEFVLPELKPIE